MIIERKSQTVLSGRGIEAAVPANLNRADIAVLLIELASDVIEDGLEKGSEHAQEPAISERAFACKQSMNFIIGQIGILSVEMAQQAERLASQLELEAEVEIEAEVETSGGLRDARFPLVKVTSRNGTGTEKLACGHSVKIPSDNTYKAARRRCRKCGRGAAVRV